MEVQRLAVPGRVVGGLALAAPVADVVGRLVAPALLGTYPLLVVCLSPSDPHLLLATDQSLAVLATIAFVVRLGRAWVIFRSADRVRDRMRPGRLQRLFAPQAPTRRTRRTGIGAVVLLPGMVGAVVAARSQLPPPLYLALAAFSTAAGLAITLVAADLFDAQLAGAAAVVDRNPIQTTAVVALLLILALKRRRPPTEPTVPLGETAAT